MAAPVDSDGPSDAVHLGQLHTLSDESRGATGWTYPLDGYMSIEGFPVSTPPLDTAHTFQSPPSGSVNVTLSAFFAEDDMSRLRFKLSAPQTGLNDDRCGQTDVWAMDITECHLTELTGDDFTTAVQHFHPNANPSA
jgi:hypothetical protein